VSPIGGLNRTLLPAELLERVAAPTLFIWGERDPFGGASTATTLALGLPHASVDIVSGAGHAPWLDELDYCAEAVRRHLMG
jgi:pimeloyl-ACP methyl ester carboxylesterase